MTKPLLNPGDVIDALGGTTKTAEICEVSGPAVAQWRKEGIPKSRLMFLRLAFPNVFSSLELKAAPKKSRRSKEAVKEPFA